MPETDAEVEDWWAENGSGELGYAGVLKALARTSSGRQALFEGFFDPTGATDDTPRGPSAAHRALAHLVATGTVKVILTTNFERLMEQGLEEAGIHPQVISRPEAVNDNCPFHPIVQVAPDIACTMNQALLAGLAEGQRGPQYEAVLERAEGPVLPHPAAGVTAPGCVLSAEDKALWPRAECVRPSQLGG